MVEARKRILRNKWKRVSRFNLRSDIANLPRDLEVTKDWYLARQAELEKRGSFADDYLLGRVVFLLRPEPGWGNDLLKCLERRHDIEMQCQAIWKPFETQKQQQAPVSQAVRLGTKSQLEEFWIFYQNNTSNVWDRVLGHHVKTSGRSLSDDDRANLRTFCQPPETSAPSQRLRTLQKEFLCGREVENRSVIEVGEELLTSSLLGLAAELLYLIPYEKALDLFRELFVPFLDRSEPTLLENTKLNLHLLVRDFDHVPEALHHFVILEFLQRKQNQGSTTAVVVTGRGTQRLSEVLQHITGGIHLSDAEHRVATQITSPTSFM